MLWPFHNQSEAKYWVKVFGLYALVEACIQLLFNYLLNHFRKEQVSNLEFHTIMWVFQCICIWPIWWVAYAVHRQKMIVQAVVNIFFFVVYSYLWLGPVQEGIRSLHQAWQGLSRSPANRLPTPVDTGYTFYYQVLKYAFRLSWFFLANYFYSYRLTEADRLRLALSNKELELKLLRWHLNPDFYFKTIDHLRGLSAMSPVNCTRPILQLSKVMEYVIYETKEKMIDVSREIHFLQNYVQLVNQQGNPARLSFSAPAAPNNLVIAPLLLAGFIDKLVAGNRQSQRNPYEIQLQFTGNNMEFLVKGDLSQYGPDFFGEQHDALYKRFVELYKDRFSYRLSAAKDLFELNMKLGEIS